MRRSSTPGRSGGTILAPAGTALASAGSLAAALALCAPPLLELRSRVAQGGEQWSTLPFGLLLTALAAAVLGACGLWLAAVILGVVLEVLTGASSALVRALTPAVVRRVVLVCCGLAVGGAGAVTSAAADPPSGTPETMGVTTPRTATALAGLQLPDRALGDAAPRGLQARDRTAGRRVRAASRIAATSAVAAAEPDHPGQTTSARWRVRRGDSLWLIAQQQLPTDARPAAIDAVWRRIYQVNESAIGTDPDLLIPGTSLRLPDRAWQGATEEARQAHPHLAPPHQARPEPETPTSRKDAS